MFRLFKRKAEVQITKDTADLAATTASDSDASSVREEPLPPPAGRSIKASPRRLPWARFLKRKAAVQLTKDDPEEAGLETEEVRQGPIPAVEGRMICGLPKERPTPQQKRRRDLNELTLLAITRAVTADKYKDLSGLLSVLVDEYKEGLEAQKAVEETEQEEVAEASEAGPGSDSVEGSLVDLPGNRGEEEAELEGDSSGVPTPAAALEEAQEAERDSEGVERQDGPVTNPDRASPRDQEPQAEDVPAQETNHSDTEYSHASGSDESQTSSEAGPSTPPSLFGRAYGPFIPVDPITPPNSLVRKRNDFDFGASSGVPAELPLAFRKDATLYVYSQAQERWTTVGKGNLKLVRTPRRTLRLEREMDGQRIFTTDLIEMSKLNNGERALEFQALSADGVQRPYALVVTHRGTFAAALIAEWELAQAARRE